MDQRFVPGIELTTRFYHEAVAPLLREHFGELPHSAARIGHGSEVLGFDTELSVDPATRDYHGRPFRVLHAERFTAALRSSITDPEIRALSILGAIDQYADSTDLLGRRRTSLAVAAAALADGS